jgi:hypothetical protein
VAASNGIPQMKAKRDFSLSLEMTARLGARIRKSKIQQQFKRSELRCDQATIPPLRAGKTNQLFGRNDSALLESA